MAYFYKRVMLLAFSVWLFGQASSDAQTSYMTNFDNGGWVNNQSILGVGNGWTGQASSVATISTNGFVYTNGATSFTYTNYVVFQGDISNSFAQVSSDTTNHLASAQLLVQVTLGSILPSATTCADRQGGICFSNNAGVGDIYAWSTNGWLKLGLTNNGAMTVASNAWVLLTFVANYSGADTAVLGGTPSNTIFYQVYLNGTNLVPSAANCYAHGSLFTNNVNGSYLQSSANYTGLGGISGFYLSGSGSMNTLLATTGTPLTNTISSPLSSQINIRAYQGADGVYVEFMTQDEQGMGPIMLQLLNASGVAVWTNMQAAVGSGNHLYRFVVPGLLLGGSYTFRVIDEVGHTFSQNATVTAFAAEMLKMSPEGVTMSFNTAPGQQYTIQWTHQLGGVWSNAIPAFTASDTHTNVFVFYPDSTAPSCFFRILQQ